MKIKKIEKYEPKTFHFKVSRLTKPWALKGCEAAIRALSGDAIKPEDKIIITINDDPPTKKSKRRRKKDK